MSPNGNRIAFTQYVELADFDAAYSCSMETRDSILVQWVDVSQTVLEKCTCLCGELIFWSVSLGETEQSRGVPDSLFYIRGGYRFR